MSLEDIVCLFKGHRYRWNLLANPWNEPGDLNLWCSRCQMTFKAERRPRFTGESASKKEDAGT